MFLIAMCVAVNQAAKKMEENVFEKEKQAQEFKQAQANFEKKNKIPENKTKIISMYQENEYQRVA